LLALGLSLFKELLSPQDSRFLFSATTSKAKKREYAVLILPGAQKQLSSIGENDPADYETIAAAKDNVARAIRNLRNLVIG